MPSLRAFVIGLLALALCVGVGTYVGGAAAQAAGNSVGLLTAIVFVQISKARRRRTHEVDED